MKIKINISGVPEHFNYPWLFAIANGMFDGFPFKVHWQEEKAGTGELCKQLENNEIQVAVVLTEGIIRHVSKGGKSRILSSYVASPLIWGIHVPAHSPINDPIDLVGKRYAISRHGSGSHLMAFVDAKNRNQHIKKEQLVVTGGLEGTREAFTKGEADVLLWEKFITKPLVRSGEFKCIGECITPWPCFVMAVNAAFEAQYPEFAEKLVHIVNAACRLFMHLPDAPEIIAKHYQLLPEDAHQWFYKTEWSCDSLLSRKVIINAQQSLYEVGLIDHLEKPEFYIAQSATLK